MLLSHAHLWCTRDSRWGNERRAPSPRTFNRTASVLLFWALHPPAVTAAQPQSINLPTKPSRALLRMPIDVSLVLPPAIFSLATSAVSLAIFCLHPRGFILSVRRNCALVTCGLLFMQWSLFTSDRAVYDGCDTLVVERYHNTPWRMRKPLQLWSYSTKMLQIVRTQLRET